jgi:hypothetical protein
MTADDAYAAAARDREQLLADLAAAKAVRRWTVMLQGSDGAEHLVCSHHWEFVAEWHARRLTARAGQLGARHTVRKADRSRYYFCSSCAANEGEMHAGWCHRNGVMGGGSL